MRQHRVPRLVGRYTMNNLGPVRRTWVLVVNMQIIITIVLLVATHIILKFAVFRIA